MPRGEAKHCRLSGELRCPLLDPEFKFTVASLEYLFRS
jgi:hypothetical protein